MGWPMRRTSVADAACGGGFRRVDVGRIRLGCADVNMSRQMLDTPCGAHHTVGHSASPRPCAGRLRKERFMKRLKAVGILAVVALVLSACGGTGQSKGASDASSLNLTYAVITHGAPGDAFWDRVKSGAERAGKDYGVKVEYSSDPDPAKQSQ